MKIIITKEQYRLLVFSLLETLVGKLSIKTIQDKWEENKHKHDYHDLYDESGEYIAAIWVKGNIRNKGCKKDLTLNDSFSQSLENYIPYYKHKIFSDVLIEYVYKYTKIKCDCIQYDYDYKHRVEKDDDGEKYEYTDAKTRKYNVKKKKKIKESVDGKSSLENLIHRFLDDDFNPDKVSGFDTNWGDPKILDLYRKHGSLAFYINDSASYIYYSDGTLEIMPWVFEKLDYYFNDLWYPSFKSWFEENSGLKVERIVNSKDNHSLLGESIDKNKKFLIDYLGEDFINGIEQITSQYDIPYELKSRLDYSTLRRMMNSWGPMYLVNINGKKYLYQDRDDYEWFMDSEGGSYVDGEILEEIGIGVMGLRFSDIIDMFF